MNTLIITKDDIDSDGFYKTHSLDFDGDIEITENLGVVKFKGFIRARLSINAKAGSGIKAGRGIEAGWGITAGRGIKAGCGIKAGWGITAGLSIHAKYISCGLRIFAGTSIYKLPSDSEMMIFGEIRKGVIAHGIFGEMK